MDILDSICQKLKPFKPILIILHGSYNNLNKGLVLNDIDLIIVSNIFTKIIFFERIQLIRNYLLEYFPKDQIDVICLTLNEFKISVKKEESQLKTSLKKGYKIIYGEFNNGTLFS